LVVTQSNNQSVTFSFNNLAGWGGREFTFGGKKESIEKIVNDLKNLGFNFDNLKDNLT
jgi:hypothetical protein